MRGYEKEIAFSLESSIQVVVVEDENLYRDLLVRTLNQCRGIKVIGEFAEAADALQHIPTLKPDVAILDISLGEGLNGVQLGLKLREQLPQLGVVLLSNYPRASVLRSVPEQSISGWSFLLKMAVTNVDMLLRAIQGAAIGLVVFDPATTRASRYQDEPLATLTARERQVLERMAQGFSNVAIARDLGLTTKTVENYVNLIFQKLGIRWDETEIQPRVQAVLLYLGRVQSEA